MVSYPVAVTLVSEYIPAHVRGRFIVLLESFLGAGLAGRGAGIALLSFQILAGKPLSMIGGLPALYAVVDLENGHGIYSFPD